MCECGGQPLSEGSESNGRSEKLVWLGLRVKALRIKIEARKLKWGHNRQSSVNCDSDFFPSIFFKSKLAYLLVSVPFILKAIIIIF